MKKLFLFSVASLLCFAADAQRLQSASVVRNDGQSPANLTQREVSPYAGKKFVQNRYPNTFKTAAAAFYTENFASGTPTTLPAGWTAAPTSGGTWKWTNVAATGTFNIGALNSSTSGNGWMIYDSDSIGNLNPTSTLITGSLTSPSINCSTHPTVQVRFQQYFRRFSDSCFVDVSNNGGTSWTAFPVRENNDMGNNTSLTNNPTNSRINITSVAGGQANVMIRFRYVGRFAGGSFNWLVDDVTLSELDPVDLSISKGGMAIYGGTNVGFSSFNGIPLQFADSLNPFVIMNNLGSTAQTNIPLNVKVFNGTNMVFDKTDNIPNMPVTDADSVFGFATQAAFWPSATGSYSVAYNATVAGDVDATNNIDSSFFTITDTTWMVAAGRISGSYNLHRPVAAGQTEVSYVMGCIFEVAAGKKDTLTSISAAFANGTTAGTRVVAQLYRFDATTTTWSPVTQTPVKTLAAADISTANTTVFANLMGQARTLSQINDYILDGGTNGTSYAAVIAGVSVPATSALYILSAEMPITRSVASTAGVGDTIHNNPPNFEFGSAGLPFGLGENVPLVRMHFGNNARKQLTVTNLAGVMVGNAYPNPANTEIGIPVAVKSNATGVKVTLSNVMGQQVRVTELGAMSAGQHKTVVIPTGDLASGTYIYTVEANGERITNKVVITH